MSRRFALNDTARVRHPLSPAEGRLATIIAIEARPDGPHGDRYRLRFPDGDECDFYASEIRPCNRADDRDGIITALTAATDSLRAACLIAHDYDEDVNVEILSAFSQVAGTAHAHLDIDLHPPRRRENPGTGPDGDPR